VRQDQRVVTERPAVDGERRGVDVGWDRGIDAGERIGEPGAERPTRLVVVLDDRLIGGVEMCVGITHICGTFSGIS